MKIRTIRWMISGGLFGLLVGGFIALGQYLLGMKEEVVPQIVYGYSYGAGGPSSTDELQHLTQVVQSVIDPFVRDSQIDRALAIIEAVGDGGTGQATLRDANLLWLAQVLADNVRQARLRARTPSRPPSVRPSTSRISPQERRSVPGPSSKDVESQFAEWDANGDGTISREEFRKVRGERTSKKGGLVRAPSVSLMPAAEASRSSTTQAAGGPSKTAASSDERRPVTPDDVTAQGHIDTPNEAATHGDAAGASQMLQKSYDIAEKIRDPLLRARAFSSIAGIISGHGAVFFSFNTSEPVNVTAEDRGRSQSLLEKSYASIQTYQSTTRSRRATRDIVSAAFWVAGSGILGTAFFGLIARALVAVGDHLGRGLGDELDSETRDKVRQLAARSDQAHGPSLS